MSIWQNETAMDAGRLLCAYLLGMPVGWIRERDEHSIGVRTFPLVALASCGYVLAVGPAGHPDPTNQSHVIQGLVAGIGFIGGGAILRAGRNVHGTATAASIWNTGVIGVAAAQDRFVLAAILAGLNVITLRLLLPLKEKLDADKDVKRRVRD